MLSHNPSEAPAAREGDAAGACLALGGREDAAGQRQEDPRGVRQANTTRNRSEDWQTRAGRRSAGIPGCFAAYLGRSDGQPWIELLVGPGAPDPGTRRVVGESPGALAG